MEIYLTTQFKKLIRRIAQYTQNEKKEQKIPEVEGLSRDGDNGRVGERVADRLTKAIVV